MRLRGILVPVVFVGAGLSLWRTSAAQPPELPPPAPLETRGLAPKFAFRGAASCAASACHNGTDTVGFRGREFALALQRDLAHRPDRQKDRHAEAYSVLLSERSRRMVQKLNGLASPELAHPERTNLCWRCHVNPEIEAAADPARFVGLEDGVSCESCHGPAERWLSEHFRPGWTSLSAAEREARGMHDTRSLVGRVRTCIECHVGSGSTDVNHDLLAAGHPRLNFEFSGAHFLLHKHWNPAKDTNPLRDPRGRPDFEARAWGALGQLVAAQAALELLAERSRKPVWPELAEYDCYACHHDLREKTWRQRSTKGRRPGSADWNEWYYAQVPAAVVAVTGQRDVALEKLLAELKHAMETAQPPGAEIAKTARHAANLLASHVAAWEKGQAPPETVDATFRQVAATAAGRPPETWDASAQAYLALSALNRARQQIGLPAAEVGVLTELRQRLTFPSGLASPRDFDPDAIGGRLRLLKDRRDR